MYITLLERYCYRASANSCGMKICGGEISQFKKVFIFTDAPMYLTVCFILSLNMGVFYSIFSHKMADNKCNKSLIRHIQKYIYITHADEFVIPCYALNSGLCLKSLFKQV